MIKTREIMLGSVALLLSSTAGNAVCSQIPLTIKDASSNTVSMSSATSADGACKTYIDEDTSSQFHTDLGLISTPTGTTGDTAFSGSGAASVVSLLKGIYSGVVGAIPAGSSLIGLVQGTTGTATLGNVIVTTALPSGTNRIGYASDDPCTQKIKTNVAIAQSTTVAQQLVASTAGSTIYICSFSLISAGANLVSLVNGTTVSCANGSTAMIGSTTVGSGLSFAANGGLTLGNGGAAIGVGVAGQGLCIVTQTGAVAGNITYVQV